MDDIKNSRSLFDGADKKAAGSLPPHTPADIPAAKLRSLFSEFAKEMREHLAEEERLITPLLRQHVTEQEHNAMVEKILQDLGPPLFLPTFRSSHSNYNSGFSGNKIMLPWILRSLKLWKPPEEVQKFYANIPAPIRFLNDMFWTVRASSNLL